MKRFLSTHWISFGGISFALMLIISLCVCMPQTSFATSNSANAQIAIVNNPNPADRLHLRQNPSSDAVSLGKYYNGTLVTVTEFVNDHWVRVTIGESGNYSGYMDANYLAFQGSTAFDTVPNAMPKYSSHSSWQLYDHPTNSSETTTYSADILFLLMGFSDDWWHIRIPLTNDTVVEGFVPANNQMRAVGTLYVNNPNPNDRLNLRTNASEEALSLFKYYSGVAVDVIKYVNATWAMVTTRDNNYIGYMHTDFLSSTSVTSACPIVTIDNKSGTGLNLRVHPNTTAQSIALYPNGTKVKVLGVSLQWCHVEIGNQKGFMISDGLSPEPQWELSLNEM